jgi:hypothetical protein
MIVAASVVAASSVLRLLIGAAFPLFATQMSERLGIHWVSSIPAFRALACLPFPFLFYKSGGPTRMPCKHASEADLFMEKMRGQLPPLNESSDLEDEEEHEREMEKEEGAEKQAADYA